MLITHDPTECLMKGTDAIKKGGKNATLSSIFL